MQQFLEWLREDFEKEPDLSLRYFIRVEEKAESLLEVEANQLAEASQKGRSQSDGMLNFMYTEVESRIDLMHNSRHKNQ